MDKGRLLSNLDKIHTTLMGYERIRKNLNIDVEVVRYCIDKICDKNCNVIKKGKNCYCIIDDLVITINSSSFTIVTSHILKK